MDAAIKRLTKAMPPPASPRFQAVNWKRLEEAVDLTYPLSFKDFVAVYGASVWFDNLSPLYTEAKTVASAKHFRKQVTDNLAPLHNGVFDDKLKPLNLPVYPEKGGLFPFLVDYGGGMCCWWTERRKPDRWPVVCWRAGRVMTILERKSLAQMILDWLDRKPHMILVWGDRRDMEPYRFRLD